MRRPLALLLLCGTELFACTLFTDLNGLSQDAPARSSPPKGDASAPGDTSTAPPADAPNIPPSDSSTTDVPIISPGDPCSDPAALIGRSDLANLGVDVIPPFVLDTYPFTATAAGAARCVWLYVENASPSKKVRVGIYTDDGVNQNPKNLAADVQLDNVTNKAWNKVALAAPITINVGDKYWIGISPIKADNDAGVVDEIAIRYKDTCTVGPFMHAMDIAGTGALPQLFREDATYNGACDAAVYLGR